MSGDGRLDLFVSYASEDRAWVSQLVAILRELGVSLWYDEVELKIGDRLRRRIDQALAACRYGVVVLSPSFFQKHWPQQELDALAQREVEGAHVILPIWLGVTAADVRRYSPALADRVAARSENGHLAVVDQILDVARPDLIPNRTALKPRALDRIRKGSELSRVIRGAHISMDYNDEPADEDEAAFIGSFLQELHDWGDIWDQLEVQDQLLNEQRLTQRIAEIENAGWTVFAARVNRPVSLRGVRGTWEVADLAVVRGEPQHVARIGDQIVVVRNEESREPEGVSEQRSAPSDDGQFRAGARGNPADLETHDG